MRIEFDEWGSKWERIYPIALTLDPFIWTWVWLRIYDLDRVGHACTFSTEMVRHWVKGTKAWLMTRAIVANKRSAFKHTKPIYKPNLHEQSFLPTTRSATPNEHVRFFRPGGNYFRSKRDWLQQKLPYCKLERKLFNFKILKGAIVSTCLLIPY